MTIQQFLSRPFPFIEGVNRKFITALAFGAFAFLFLYLFKPFGLGVYTSKQLLLYSLGFGGTTFLVMLINFLVLEKIFPAFFKEENWNVGKEILITLVYIAMIGSGNFLFATSVSITKATFAKFLYLETITLCMGVLPVIVWTLIRENMLLKQNRIEAEKFSPLLKAEKEEANQSIKTRSAEPGKTVPPKDQPVVFTSENEASSLELVPGNILFISSADNYIKIFNTENDNIKIHLFRSSLKNSEEDLKEYPQFFRCHRAYIVNLLKVDSVTGNARGLKLSLKNCPDEVPVSRSLNEEIKVKLQQIHSG